MPKNIKIYSSLIIIILSIHFLLVITAQCYDQGWSSMKFEIIEKINNNYINPYFEQNWGMFAPNPPRGNEYISLKFHTAMVTSQLINIHEKIKQNSFKNPFSLDQRTIKYLNECYSDILVKNNLGYSNEEFIKNSHGLQSILNYSKIVLSKQKNFIKKININDSIKVDLYLIQEPLNSFEKSKQKREQFYIKIEDLNLTTKIQTEQ